MNSQFAKLALELKPLALCPIRNADANVRLIVRALGQEPKPGFVANELTVALHSGIEVAITSRDRGQGIALVRVNGETVFRSATPHGGAELTPGAWQAVIESKAEALFEIEMHRELQEGGILALPKAA